MYAMKCQGSQKLRQNDAPDENAIETEDDACTDAPQIDLNPKAQTMSQSR